MLSTWLLRPISRLCVLSGWRISGLSGFACVNFHHMFHSCDYVVLHLAYPILHLNRILHRPLSTNIYYIAKSHFPTKCTSSALSISTTYSYTKTKCRHLFLLPYPTVILRVVAPYLDSEMDTHFSKKCG